MSYLSQPQDASMEDILSSIRKILDEEPTSPKPSAPKKKEEPIELTEIVEERFSTIHSQDKVREPLEGSDEPLMSPTTLSASIAALSSLKDALEPTTPQSTYSKTTIEEIVTNLLTPLLKEWVNQNLSTLVEKVVREEVQRLTQRLS